MLLSIIIPVYNVSEYLEKCVNSVLIGDMSDCEIILVDDGSTDGISGALCDRIATENNQVVTVIHQKNKGLGGARNTGIEVAKGEYLFFVDSDDFVAPNFLDVIKDTIHTAKPDIISFNLRTDDGEGNGKFIVANYIDLEDCFHLESHPEFLFSLPSACCRVWKRKLFVDNDIYFPERVWYEDIRTTSKLFAVAESIYTLKDALYHYFTREGSIMRSSNVGRNREIIDAFEDLITWYKKNGLFEIYKDALCGLCMENLYIAASVRVLKVDTKHLLLKEFREYIEEVFPDYKKNSYINSLSGAKKLAYYLLEFRQYKVLQLLFKIKDR